MENNNLKQNTEKSIENNWNFNKNPDKAINRPYINYVNIQFQNNKLKNEETLVKHQYSHTSPNFSVKAANSLNLKYKPNLEYKKLYITKTFRENDSDNKTSFFIEKKEIIHTISDIYKDVRKKNKKNIKSLQIPKKTENRDLLITPITLSPWINGFD